MSVPEQIPTVSYTANGTTTNFPITFELSDERYLVVTKNMEIPPVGAYTVLNGNVVFGVAPNEGDIITLMRDTVLDREANYQNYDNSFRPEAVNYDLDKIWHVLQEQQLIDAQLLARVKEEIEWRRVNDNVLQHQIQILNDIMYGIFNNASQDYLNEKLKAITDAIDIAAAAGAGENGWTASLVVDASGKTQQQINDFGGVKWRNKAGGYDLNARVMLDNGDIVISTVAGNTVDPNIDMTGWFNFDKTVLDPNLAPLGWIQKDFNDSIVDVRKFIKKDLSNVTTGLQAAIEAAYGQTLHIPIPLQILDTMYVGKGLSILGVNRSVTNYNTDPNVLDFSLLGAGKSAFEIATTSPVIGFQLEKLFLRGAKNGGQALKIGASLANNLADFNVKDLIIYNFSKGIEQQYCWDGRYENMRIQACTNGITHNSQSNVIHYDKCAIVTIDDLALEFINSEGVQFDCCDISNLTKTNGAPITLFQSAVAFNTGYFENISNANLALVGTVSEANGSRLTFNTPFKLAKNVLCGSNIAFVDIKQPDSNDVKVVGATLTTEANAIVAKRNNGLVNKSVFLWHAKRHLTITGYGGVTATYQDYRNYLLLNSTSAAGGWNVTNSLEVGKVYTVMYSIRSTANTVGLALRHPSAQSSLRANAVGEAVTIKTVSFVATSATLNMTWEGDIELYGIQIVEGNLSAMANDPFLQADFSQPVTISRSAVPTVGTWRVGDKVENSNPTTYAGWICTVAGSPGTWKQYGAIV